MIQGKKKSWLGGYIRWGRRGPSYVIERWIDGTRYHVSTKCRTERAALDQLALFETDPASYKPSRKRLAVESAAKSKPVVMTAELITEYCKWLTTRDHKPTSQEHADRHETRLEKWLEFLNGRDIRTVKLKELRIYLEPLRDKFTRIQSIRCFCAWLREHKFAMERNEDPTLDLRTPPRRATKDTKQVAIEPERILKVLPHLPEVSRDVMILRLGTGWHSSEVARFAVGGTIKYTPGKFVHLMTEAGPQKVPLLAVLHVRQKISVTTKTPILYREHLEAAERIQARRYVPVPMTLRRHLRIACEAAGVEYFWNWHIRHSVISNAVEEGADLKDTSVFVDHLNIDTTRHHYLQLGLPKKAVPVLRVLDGGKEKAG